MEKIITITKENIDEFPTPCFMKCDNLGYQKKLRWLENKFKNGLKIKQLYLEKETKANGFIEYLPSEFAERAIECKNYLFIHCIWMYPNKFKLQTYGTKLIQEVILEAKSQKKTGVAVVTSSGSFMASKDIFLKLGFKEIETEGIFSLLAFTFKNNEINLPKFKDYKKQLEKYKEGLYIVHSNQCPWVARSIDEFSQIAKKNKLKLNIIELKNSTDIQNAPSIYAVFNLIKDGKVLADHYISSRRFENILKSIK